MAGDEPDLAAGSISGGAAGGFQRGGIRRAIAGRIAAKVTTDGVRKLTGEFNGLLGTLKKVREELTQINKLASSAGGMGGVGQGTPTGAAGTGTSGTGLVGGIAQQVAGGTGGSGPILPTAAVRGAGGFNYARIGAGAVIAANAINTGLDIIGDRFQRNVQQSAPISSVDVATASMYGPSLYRRLEGSRYNGGQGTTQFLGSREGAQAAQQIGLGFGMTMGSSNQFMASVGGMVQASGGAMGAAQAAATVGQFAAPMVSNRARAMGIMAYKDNGVLNNPLTVGLDYIKDYEKRNNVTMNEIDYSNLRSPGSPHRARMKQLYGLSDEAIDTVIQAGMQNMQFRTKTGGGRNINFSNTEDLSKLGLNASSSLGLAATRLNTTTERREARFFNTQEGAMVNRMTIENRLQEALSETEEAFGGLLGVVHELERGFKALTGLLGIAGGVMMAGSMLGGRGGGGGLLGSLGNLLGGLGGGGGTPGSGQMTLPGMAAPSTAGRIAGIAGKAGGIAAGGALAIGGMAMANSARTPGGAALGVGMSTAGGAMIGTMIMPGVGTAVGAGVGFVAGAAFAAKNYFSGVDKKNVESGYEEGVGMPDDKLIASLGDYVKNREKDVKRGRGQGAGAKQRGRFDAFAQRRGTLLAAALDEAVKTGAITPASSSEGTAIADLVNFFSSGDKVRNDSDLWSNRSKAEPFISKLRHGEIWKKYFGPLSDPFDYKPVTTEQSKSLVMTGAEAYAAGTGQASATTGDAMFAATGSDLWRTGDAIDDRAIGKGDTWNKLDSRMKDRLLKLFRASGGRVWLGGGWRSTAQQEAMFRDRYVPDPNGSIEWNGQKWKHVKGAAAAPPGRSMHEIGLAADLEGDLAWMNAHAAEFGLKDAHDINSEPWHVQPAELPYSRRAFEAAGGTSDSSGGQGAVAGAAGSGGNLSPATATTAPTPFGGGGGASISGIGYSMAAAAGATVASGGLLTPTGSAAVGGGSLAPSGGPVGAGAGGSLQAFFTEVLNAIGAPVTQNNLDKLAAIAKQEGNGVDHFNPFNTNTRAPGSVSFNSAGVQKYPDWATGVAVTARLLNKRPTMGSNLHADGSFADFIAAVDNFYASWGGGRNTISQTNARAFLSHPVTGPGGDAAFDPGISMMGPSSMGSSMGGGANVNIAVTINSTGNVGYDAHALGEAVRPVLSNVMAEISTKRGS